MRQRKDRNGMHWIFDRESFAKLRKERGYSHAELAKLLKVTLNTIYAWESGGKMPPSTTVCEIADILDVEKESIAFDRELIYNRVIEYRSLYNSIKEEFDDKYALAVRTAYSNIKAMVDAKDFNGILGDIFADEVKQSPIASDIIKYSIPIAASMMNIFQERLEEVE